jgi:NDP-sugar pyrophosphorylase family protein
MKALLLAAGLGTRLKPFTFSQAKSSLPFLNAPLIHYPLQYLSANGIEETIINLHAHPESVQRAVGNEYRGMQIQYSHEPTILGTAGAMAKASPFLESEPFVVMNSDMICEIPLMEVMERHKLTGNLVSLVMMAGERTGYNPLFYDPDTLKLTREGSKCHYTGVQIVDRSVVEKIPVDRKTEIFRDVYPELIDQNRVGVFLYDGLWLEMGTLQQFLTCSLKMIESPLPAHLSPPQMQLSLISDNAKLEPGSDVSDTILMNGAVVEQGVRLERCIVGPDVRVTQNHTNAALARGILPWYF